MLSIIWIIVDLNMNDARHSILNLKLGNNSLQVILTTNSSHARKNPSSSSMYESYYHSTSQYFEHQK
jgi:hypothetical protein